MEKQIAEGLKRKPWQAPQTSMERHIVELVEHLKNGCDNRSGFAAEIERALEHAFSLEAACQRLRNENLKLEDMLTVRLPSVNASWRDHPPSAFRTFGFLEWRMESISFCAALPPYQSGADQRAWSRIRRNTFRGLLKLVREQFDATFPKQTPNSNRSF